MDPLAVEVALPAPTFDVTKTRPWSHRTIDLSLHLIVSVTFFTAFVAAFFFLVVSWVEVRSIENNTNRVVGELFEDLKSALTPEQRFMLRSTLKTSLTAPKLEAEDRRTRDKNKTLVEQTLIILGSGFGAGVLAIFALWAVSWKIGYQVPMGKILLQNLLLLGFVVVAEVTFLFVIGGEYRSLDANLIRRHVLGTIRAFAKR